MADEDDVRALTEEEKIKLEDDSKIVSKFKQNKLEKEAQKNWDLFYKRNATNFFKDRHWTTAEFKELLCESRNGESDFVTSKILLEAGCGVGNLFYPLLEEIPNLFIHACDFSKRAIDFVKEHPAFSEEKVNAFHCDLTVDALESHVPKCSVDIATLVFVLSAVHPDKMLIVLQNVIQVLKPGGLLFFRDYGLYDHAMLRFSPANKLSDNFYVRQDGTRAYYFSKDLVETLFHQAGFETLVNDYAHRRTVNKKEGVDVPRIFVQAKFRKPGKPG
ncbi:methyltransferase-like protein 6 [Pocillopora damicornis]|uniref:methyltransferase-like protein 6 n=1 Tax=Pocillopora damicornis TaxID=46731 RepID=UPI000F551342|nr:methyltransferase-like protein 6 [Pocillopora damicornis]XP_027048403.1 methyltransferase-like protein 6 [Pocillopora damicornis]